MKVFNKILYDILFKINNSQENIKINKNLVYKYFPEFDNSDQAKYQLFDEYFINFYHFCFELPPKNMIKDALKFMV